MVESPDHHQENTGDDTHDHCEQQIGQREQETLRDAGVCDDQGVVGRRLDQADRSRRAGRKGRRVIGRARGFVGVDLDGACPGAGTGEDAGERDQHTDQGDPEPDPHHQFQIADVPTRLGHDRSSPSEWISIFDKTINDKQARGQDRTTWEVMVPCGRR
ncbi:hypothetical protein ACFQX6_06045 [Streptosporangium lutulentum]